MDNTIFEVDNGEIITLIEETGRQKFHNDFINKTKNLLLTSSACSLFVEKFLLSVINGLKPYLYLTYVLERLRQLGPFPKSEELDSLLPWAEELPEEIETKTKPKK